MNRVESFKELLFSYPYFGEHADKVRAAVGIAERAHKDQVRKGSGEPFLVHPLDVAVTFLYAEFEPPVNPGNPEFLAESACILVLHDVLEDGDPLWLEEWEFEIFVLCGKKILDSVRMLTNPSKGSRESRAVRKKMDRDHLAACPENIRTYKAVDRLCNVSDMVVMGGFEKQFLRLYARETRELLEVLGDIPEKLTREILWWVEQMEKTGEGD